MQRVRYVRLYADAQGESHFENVEIELVPVEFAPPSAPLDFAQLFPVTSSYLVGVSVDWHGEAPHPEYEVTASDGEKRRFPGGSLLLLEDTSGKGHSTRVISTDFVLIVGIALAD